MGKLPTTASSSNDHAENPQPNSLRPHQIEPPIRIDYGSNLHIGAGVFINFNATLLDTCAIHIGARSLLASNVSLFSGTHPLDPEVRNGTQGPEGGKEIWVGEDCWLGGNVTVLPGVRVGRGAVVGAGSVVTKVSLRWVGGWDGMAMGLMWYPRMSLSTPSWRGTRRGM